MSWVKWDLVYSSYENGGLNIGSLESKNLALLGKWWWRFKTKTGSFWVKIIHSIYGDCGRVGLEADVNHSSISGLWCNIITACHKIEDLNIPFRNSFVKSIGDGSSTSFRKDHWIEDFTLRDKFPQLFRLESSENVLICDRIIFTSDATTSVWSWKRPTSGRTTTELTVLVSLIAGFSFNHHEKDRWSWSLSTNGRFTIKMLSNSIDEKILSSTSNSIETLRNNLVPKKVEIFVWSALKRRIPVRIELDKKGIDLHSARCPICDDDMEMVEHSLIFCKQSLDLWNSVFEWWHLGKFSNLSINETLRGNVSVQTSKFANKIWPAVEWVCAYYIWKNRNNKVF
ncbi:uncharacterized protein [Rutidosis leptorrhynchoides]|uniref:uncharacterized protein n=1 Tax=Rutidosis leptorrhynchoides TaxID=125765 RepID=UPI003A99EA79